MLSARLYTYNRVPASRRWRRLFPNEESVEAYLGIRRRPRSKSWRGAGSACRLNRHRVVRMAVASSNDARGPARSSNCMSVRRAMRRAPPFKSLPKLLPTRPLFIGRQETVSTACSGPIRSLCIFLSSPNCKRRPRDCWKSSMVAQLKRSSVHRGGRCLRIALLGNRPIAGRYPPTARKLAHTIVQSAWSRARARKNYRTRRSFDNTFCQGTAAHGRRRSPHLGADQLASLGRRAPNVARWPSRIPLCCRPVLRSRPPTKLLERARWTSERRTVMSF